MTDTDFSKATERPWKQHLVDSTAIVSASGGNLVAKVEGDYDTDWQEIEANAALIVAAVNSYDPEREKKVEALVSAAQQVMGALEEYGPSIVPHLMDTDQNAGQRLREALQSLKGGENG